MPASNLYDILGIREFSDAETIKAAYKRLVKTAHPDKGGDARLFDVIVQAYRILIDNKSRSIYDRNLVNDFRASKRSLKGIRRDCVIKINLLSVLRPEGCQRVVIIDGKRYYVIVPYGIPQYTVLEFKDVLPYGQVLASRIRITLPKGVEFRTVNDEPALFYVLKVHPSQKLLKFKWLGKPYIIGLKENPHDKQIIIIKREGYVSQKTGERNDLYVELRLNV